MDRRAFLRRLLAAPLAATVDWEKLLWVPRTQIVVPALRCATIDELNAVTMAGFHQSVMDNFFKATPLLEYLRSPHPVKFATVASLEF